VVKQIHRRSIYCIIATVGFSVIPFSSQCAFADDAPATTQPAPDDQDKNKAVYAELAHVLPAVQMDKVSLEDCIGFLRDVTGAKMTVRWDVIEAAHIDKSAIFITMHAENQKFSTVLKGILDQAGPNKLAYAVQVGAIVISTPDDLKTEK
jgi:hypothetical protein